MISLRGRLLGNSDMANYIKRIKLTNLKAGILTFQLSYLNFKSTPPGVREVR